MHRCVEGDDVDVIFQVFQQLVKLLGAAAAVGEDLHLVGEAARRARLDVPQVDALLLRRAAAGCDARGEPSRKWIICSPGRAGEL